MRFGVGIAAVAIVALGGCAARGGTGDVSETSPGACSDGRDNDGDGLIDCADPSCTIYAWCADAGDTPNDVPSEVAYCGDPIDVVFVVDVSTSMGDDLMAIRTAIDTIWNATAALSSSPQFSLVVFVDDVLAVNGCAPFAAVADLQAELQRWQSFCSTNQDPGGGGYNSDCPENSLDALYVAATACPWRPNSTRIAIHVTDDTFAERPTVLSSVFGIGGVPVQHTYPETVAALQGSQVRAGVLAHPGAGDYCGAGTSPNVGQGFFEPYNGMASIPVQTGGTAWSILDARAGTLDLAAAINAMISSEYCTVY